MMQTLIALIALLSALLLPPVAMADSGNVLRANQRRISIESAPDKATANVESATAFRSSQSTTTVNVSVSPGSTMPISSPWG